LGLKGNLGTGHVRYSTTGASTRDNAQPLVINYIKGTLYLLLINGTLINTKELRQVTRIYRGYFSDYH
jgi:amidophosphoribosyltransferase